MGKGKSKIAIKRIENKLHRKVTFTKRRDGLFKKAAELCLLTNTQIALIVFSATDKLYSFGGHSSVDSLLHHYHNGTNPPQITLEDSTLLLNRIEESKGNHKAEQDFFWFKNVQVEKIDSLDELKRMTNAMEKVRENLLTKISQRRSLLCSQGHYAANSTADANQQLPLENDELVIRDDVLDLTPTGCIASVEATPLDGYFGRLLTDDGLNLSPLSSPSSIAQDMEATSPFFRVDPLDQQANLCLSSDDVLHLAELGQMRGYASATSDTNEKLNVSLLSTLSKSATVEPTPTLPLEDVSAFKPMESIDHQGAFSTMEATSSTPPVDDNLTMLLRDSVNLPPPSFPCSTAQDNVDIFETMEVCSSSPFNGDFALNLPSSSPFTAVDNADQQGNLCWTFDDGCHLPYSGSKFEDLPLLDSKFDIWVF